MADQTRRRLLTHIPASLLAIPLAGGLIAPLGATAAAPPQVILFKPGGCDGCNAWTAEMRQFGFRLEIASRPDMAQVKDYLEIPHSLRACHTALANGYVIEGHVPPEEVLRLLTDQPGATGLARPAPFPEGGTGDGIYLFGKTGISLYSSL